MSISTFIQGIQGLREWYRDLNSATLTGAIDVIVVEQEDGTFLSSPFHVRFGKLGVLKAKEKIVDIEINDEPVDIHMKLDDAGAAFFVEGLDDEEQNVGIPPELATSPLPHSYFPPHWESKGKEGKSCTSANRSLIEAFNQEENGNESSTSNSTNDCGPTNKKYDRIIVEESQLEMGQEAMEESITAQKDSNVSTKEGEANVAVHDVLNNKKKLNQKKRKRRSMNKKHIRSNSKSSIKDIVLEADFGDISEITKKEAQNADDIFDMDDVNDENEAVMESTPTPTHNDVLDLKISTVPSIQPEMNTISTSVPSTALAISFPNQLKDPVYTPSLPNNSSFLRLKQLNVQNEDVPSGPSTGSLSMKTPTPQNCTNENSFLSSRLRDQEQLTSLFSKPEIDGCEYSDEGSKNIASCRNSNMHYFSDPENYSPTTSPIGSRSGTPIMSDSEIMSESSELRKAKENAGKERGEQSWEWGQLPSTTTTPAQDKVAKLSKEDNNGEKAENTKNVTSTEESGWKFLWFRGRSESSKTQTKEEDNSTKKNEIKDDKNQLGVTLESLKTEEEIQKYIGSHFHGNVKSHPITTGRVNSYTNVDSDTESGNGPSLPMSPHSVEGTLESENQYYPNDIDGQPHRILKDIDISLCGAPVKGEEFSPKLFELHKVPFDDFTMKIKMGNNPFDDQNLVVRIGEQYYTWKAASPIIFSIILYGRPFPSNITEEMGSYIWSGQKRQEKNYELGETLTTEAALSEQRKHSSWWPLFGSKGNEEGSIKQDIQSNKSSEQDIAEAVATAFGATEVVENEVQTPSKITSECETPTTGQVIDKTANISSSDDQVDDTSQQLIDEPKLVNTDVTHISKSDSLNIDKSTSIIIDTDSTPTNNDISIDIDKISACAPMGESLPKTPPRIPRAEFDVSSSSETAHNNDILRSENLGKFKKTLRLSSDLIRALNLRPGSNEVQFSVTTAYQGTTKCRCHLYLWKWTDKIVISDIDGTITKSDVLGHILPIIGKDWAQSGVASLFTKIVSNGYHIAYLSARSIGHAAVTKDYLKSVNQGAMNLPDGPLLLNPTSLVSALHREVIIKKPEEFKIACLRDIQKLFPENPFYCGYGNRTNDVFAYRAVGIPISRIFTINSQGELRHELTQTFQTSYVNQSSMVDHIFPPACGEHGHTTSTQIMNYSTFTFWREPVPDINLHFENENKKADTNNLEKISEIDSKIEMEEASKENNNN